MELLDPDLVNGTASALELALLGQVMLWLAVGLAFLLTRQASIYHPLTVYLGFHGLVFVIRPLLVCYLGFHGQFDFMQFEPSEASLVRALLVSSVGLVAFSVSSLAFGWSSVRFTSPSPPPFTSFQKRSLVAVTVILTPIILYSMHSLVSGGLQVEDRGGRYVMVGASGYTIEAQVMGGSLICAWLGITRFRWPALLVVLPYVLYRSWAGTARWTILLLFLVIVLTYAWQARGKWPPFWSILLAIPVLALFNVIGDNREYFQQLLRGEEFRRGVEHPGARLIDQWRTKYDSPDFANFDFLTFVTAVVPERSATYTYGSQYLQLFTEPIPRKLWAGKPVGIPFGSFSLHSYGNFFGRTPSLVGDGWMSGGWLGLFITMALAGGAVGLLHRRFWKEQENNMFCLGYLIMLAMLPQWFRDGGISIAKFLFWNLTPLGLWIAVTWLLGPRLVPGYSLLLPSGGAFHLLEPKAREPLPAGRTLP